MLRNRPFRCWLVGTLLACAACGGSGHESSVWEAMGTSVAAEVRTRTRPDAAQLLEEIRERIEAGARDLDPAGPEGELGRVNRRAADEFYEIQRPDVYRCVKLALDYAKQSQGAYDPTLGALSRLYFTRGELARPLRPTEIDLALSRVGWEKVTLAPESLALRFRAAGLQLDLGEVGRGCVLDWAARTFARPGTIGGLLRLGDTYRAWGSPPDAAEWSVALRDPRDPERELLRLRVTNRGLAVAGHRRPETAGRPLRAGDPLFLDGRTGRPAATDLVAAVGIADSAADAAALSHAVFVAGSLKGPSFMARTRRTEAVLVVSAGGGTAYVVASASLEGRIELSAELQRETGGDVRYLLPPQSL